MTWEQCGYFKHRLVDLSGKVIGRVERSHHTHEWAAYKVGIPTGLALGDYVSEEQAKQAVEKELLRGDVESAK